MSTPRDGRKTVTTAGTSETLVSNSFPVVAVIIIAETNNTGVITIGDSTVVAAESTRRGVPLLAGESVSFPISDLLYIHLDTTVNGDGVTYLAII